QYRRDLERSTPSIRSALSSGTRDQYTHPPKGSLNGTPSTSTSVRLTPLGPMPRSETPCDVGCDDRLLLRRKRLKGVTDPGHPANPPARTTIVRLPPGTSASVNRPSGPVTVCCSRPLLPSTLTDAPETAPLASSRTIPDTDDWAAAG